jgi:hypothetical protein
LFTSLSRTNTVHASLIKSDMFLTLQQRCHTATRSNTSPKFRETVVTTTYSTVQRPHTDISCFSLLTVMDTTVTKMCCMYT